MRSRAGTPSTLDGPTTAAGAGTEKEGSERKTTLPARARVYQIVYVHVDAAVPGFGGTRARPILLFPVDGQEYRYELRRGDELIATGHLSRQEPLEVGDRIKIGRRDGIVRIVEPLLGGRELRLVVQLATEDG